MLPDAPVTYVPDCTELALRIVRLHLPRQGPVTTEDFVAFAQGARVQCCDVFIEDADPPLEVRLFLPQPALPPQTAAELPLEDAKLPVLVRDFAAEIVASTRVPDPAVAPAIAASVAVMRSAWAWDERSEFAVAVDGVRWLAAPRYEDNRRWSVTVRSDAG